MTAHAQIQPGPTGLAGRRASLAVWATGAALLAGLAAFGLYLVLNDPSDPRSVFFDRVLYCALNVIPGVLALARAVLVRRERLAWTLLGLNLLALGIAEVIWAIFYVDVETAPYPSVVDALYLVSYPLTIAGLAVLARDRIRRLRPATWIDASVAALTMSAFGAALLLPAVVASGEGSLLPDAVTISYPVLDTIQVAFLLGVLVLVGWRVDLSWLLIIASLALLPVADGIYSYKEATTGYVEGTLIDLLWPASAVLLGIAAWVPSRRATALPPGGWRSLATPAMFMLAAGGLVLYGYLAEVNAVAVGLAGAALLAAGLRLLIAYRENQRLFESAQSDPLTGLGNRSALLIDIEDAFASAGHSPPRTLAMFDLNGFKLYNDTFGHPAGDAMLARLAKRLDRATGDRGRAYRIGGDEFCVLLECPIGETQGVIARAIDALSERGEAFEVSTACGTVVLSAEAQTPQSALQIADRRMYQDKSGSRSSARSQAQEVLIRALRERQPDLGDHVDQVSQLSTAVARRLGIEGEALDVIRRAAELHDIGKMAVPDAVLEKPGPLDAEEWEFIRDHTIVGERILREAPALAPVADLVRSSHERWDGEGYPDGLAGEEIPFGARIIFACDAYEAMTRERPYAAAMRPEDAVAELRRCAGTQFDPSVIEVLCAELGSPARQPQPRDPASTGGAAG
jgi:two-component system cell cycle response regulator